MLEYLSKYNNLPADLRAKVSTPAVMGQVEILEKKYGLDLAGVIMRVMIRDITLDVLTNVIQTEYKLRPEEAKNLVEELKSRVFAGVGEYLGIVSKSKELKGVTEGLKRIDPSIPSTRDSGQGANFFLYPEDEEDVRALAGKAHELQVANNNENLDKKVDKIIEDAKISFGSQELANRFKSVVKINLKGIRDKIETRGALMKNVADGGLAMSEAETDRIMAIVKSVSQLKPEEIIIKKPPVIRVEEDDVVRDSGSGIREAGFGKRDSGSGIREAEKKDEPFDSLRSLRAVGARDIEFDLKKAIAEKKNAPKVPENLPIIDNNVATPSLSGASDKASDKNLTKNTNARFTSSDNASNKNVATPSLSGASVREAGSGKREAIKSLPSVKEIKFLPKAVQAETPSSDSTVKFRTPTIAVGGKKIMADVRSVPRIMNPIDELKFLDLVNFRRLSDDPIIATKKIIEKFAILEKDRYGRRLEGIQAWRQSPVNRLYVKIGQESMLAGKPIDDIIEAKKKKGEDYLTHAEFDAVMNMNRAIRF